MVDIVIGEAGTLATDLLSAALVESGFEVHCAATGGLIDAVVEHGPRLVLTAGAPETTDGSGDDPEPAPEHATALPARLAGSGGSEGAGGAAVIVVTDDARRGSVDAAVAAGVRGYVHHSAGLGGLVDAVRRVDRGEVVVVVPHQHAVRHAGREEMQRIAATLTARELECLGMLVEGVSTQQITTRLGISTMTVRSHVQSILSKLGAHSRLEAVSLAVRHGLLDDHRASTRAG